MKNRRLQFPDSLTRVPLILLKAALVRSVISLDLMSAIKIKRITVRNFAVAESPGRIQDDLLLRKQNREGL
ncbi:hypothetical protein BFF98_07380 [Corynebacterium pseudotuberculosis]|nr:hypothetical protein ATN03_06630 [Corynebacterium pseudotuberculosis]AMN73523.1 hypothetical protein ATN04_03595 [Corynebacterium pseudotuberculosis]AMN76312.1 hypothetical protein ATN05_08535 [Corynebacterium pseudotuberculosis]ANZ92425.1 hypothetical protein CPMB20_08545 [Corynebacterium pseudotuberculosis]ATB62254.1 Hypothetical protein BFF96_1375 [Corynebacterium pseudotuberculosis]